MAAALVSERANAGRHFPLSIGGETVDTGNWDKVRPPATPEIVHGFVGRARPSDIDLAVTAARTAAGPWRDTATEVRCALLRRAAERLTEARYEFAAAMAEATRMEAAERRQRNAGKGRR